jgi:hypothetical protein
MTSIAPHTTVDAAAPGDEGLDGREAKRWMLLLGVPFVIGASLFAVAIGTDTMWLLMLAAMFGPGLIILGFTYLGLTADTDLRE